MGFVGYKHNMFTYENGKSIDYVVISRRNISNAGSRFWRRGVDSNGNAANFIETEQILVHENKIVSFVQLRGSIPLQWTQKPTGKIVPPIFIQDSLVLLFLLNNE